MTEPSAPMIAIACGGTGGHLFPGLAVGEQLVKRGCAVMLLVSPKEVDQQAVKMAQGVEIVTLPAVGLQNRNYFSFGSRFLKSYFAARKAFAGRKPAAVLAMGGFTSAPPIFAARKPGAKRFLHESNTIPGRANRWLSRFVNQCFVGFPQAGARLRNENVTVTGTPVRTQFQSRYAGACRAAVGLAPGVPMVLVMGGSQGASGINELVARTLPLLAKAGKPLQFLHLTGPGDAEKVRRAYSEAGLRGVVHPFFAEMELALGAATVAVSRSGASSLAELAAVRVPCILIPYPAATDNHQYFNAKAFEETGAARLLEQKSATPETLAGMILELAEDDAAREQMQAALGKWHSPQAAERIAETMLQAIAREKPQGGRSEEGRVGAKTERGGLERAGLGAVACGVEAGSAVSPHPGPIPRGEGAALSRARAVHDSVTQSSVGSESVASTANTGSQSGLTSAATVQGLPGVGWQAESGAQGAAHPATVGLRRDGRFGNRGDLHKPDLLERDQSGESQSGRGRPQPQTLARSPEPLGVHVQGAKSIT